MTNDDALIGLIEPLVDVIQPLVDVIQPLFDVVEPLADDADIDLKEYPIFLRTTNRMKSGAVYQEEVKQYIRYCLKEKTNIKDINSADSYCSS